MTELFNKMCFENTTTFFHKVLFQALGYLELNFEISKVVNVLHNILVPEQFNLNLQ